MTETLTWRCERFGLDGTDRARDEEGGSNRMFRSFFLMLVIALTVAWTAIPVLAAGNDVPSADDVLKQLAGDKVVSPGDLAHAVIVKSMHAIRFLQSWAAPVTVILILIAGLLVALGLLFGSRELKRLGVGGIIGAVVLYVLVRLAPLFVVGLSRMVG